MASSRDELMLVALAEFARNGYVGTSLQHIADAAGLSKSSVLYHFTSKEALLEASLAPAVDALGELLGRTGAVVDGAEHRPQFIADFVDLLLEHRLAVHIFINQSRGLVDVPVIDRATAIVERIGSYFMSVGLSVEDKVRFGVALGGAAYLLVASDEFAEQDDDLPGIREALTTVLTELLAPVSTLPITE